MSNPRAKNIILMVFDYMGYADIEPFGPGEIRTPNIRRLAEQGIRYSDCYAPAPICVPSRAALMTGRYPRHLGIENNIYHGEPGLSVGEKSLARYFKDAGFKTALYGKWHLGYEAGDSPTAHGFDDFIGFHEWNIDYYSHKTHEGADGLYHNGDLISRDGYTTDLFTDCSVDFISDNAKDPFFLYLAYNAALPPYSPPGWKQDNASIDAWKKGSRADYVAMIEHLDGGVGRVLQALEDHSLADDTLILLTYDHGGTELASDSPYFHGFGTLWEGGIRVPMIMNWPNGLTIGNQAPANQATGTVCEQPAILMDATATLLAAAGIVPDQAMDGVDLLSPAAAACVERPLHWRLDLPDLHGDWRARAQKAVRRGKWKYLWDGGFEFLHDLDHDPGERKNLSGQHPEILAELRALSNEDW